ncbi:NADH:flavin oxidoreductase/NADH oxidase [Agromyces aerolatus]|uniref:NADH:flavin oxidoreductase/NADH oxidase n=1 Tax=Agromyces sp. LY-1074 TaxID=3074080 RepID=UPI00286268C4|nr:MULTISPECIES: NADH:flavin oxidoreductase/NADH oxidase [unclassified Agromyces]MDR5700504.1 NADH:flavin oxidoreductase/NADH oxidase [Agromyces sp. LY-1074]MDR5707025.1 NADH:flavin oxidoreductase/NADH oxidase [Agromyces sp. LY-1358]
MPPSLFSPITIGSTTARNRIWVSPMCQYSVLDEDGVPGDWQLSHLGSMAAGGAGLVIAEATAIRPDGRISPRDTGLWNDRQEQEWARIVRHIRAQGAVAGIQLAHAGRKASTFPLWGSERRGTVPAAGGGWETVGPSPIAFGDLAAPRALTESEILEVIEQFADAAVRAERAGFDVVEVHAAHGYLLHQFLSPLSNHREDRWGGSFEHRVRLTVEVVRRVRERVAIPVLVRFSATDWVPSGGWDLEQTIAAADLVRAAGADLIDVSTGGNVLAPIPVGPGYQVEFASELRARTGIPTAAVGLITDARQAQAIVETGQADAVLLGREFLRDPHTPLRFARELEVDESFIRELCAPPHRRAYA